MRFEFATVKDCNPSGCWVTPVRGGEAFEARYSELVKNKVRILPGQLVAVDMEPVVPEVAWRWYRARVVDAWEGAALVQERERQLSAASVPGLEIPLLPGEEIWVTGMEGVWELHDRVSEDKPADPERLSEKVLPRIQALLEKAG